MKYFLLSLFCVVGVGAYSQKTIFIPSEFTTDPFLKNWSQDRSYQSENFVLFWGSVVGTDPKAYANADLRFNPQAVCDTLEKSYTKYVKEIGFCSEDTSKNLGKYKIIIVMNDTWGNGGPSGWAFGGAYENTIGAMWVHPNSTRDGGVISHEFAHSLQAMISIQENPDGGFVDNDVTGFFWECHANFMRTQIYPRFASDDMPRWMATSMFHWSSTRHHYSSFRLLLHIQQLDGIAAVNDLWKKSVSNEHPLMTYKRLKGFSQEQFNDFVYDYAKREVIFDYPVNNAGAIMRERYQQFIENEPHYLWRRFTVLKQLDVATGRYITDDVSAPQDYGYNLVPLYPDDITKEITITFKGHKEVNNVAGWRYGFIAVKNDGVSVRYSDVYAADEGEVSFKLESDETKLYLVVTGAPITHTNYVWEPGWPKIKRFPYEIAVENAVPEGYQNDFRSTYKVNGHAHANGGGWVSNEASVDASVYVGPKAIVLGSSVIIGSVKINGTAWVENVKASDNVVINGNSNVWNGTYSDNAHIGGNAILNHCTVSGNAEIKGDAMEWGVTLGGSVVVGGDAEIGDCSTGVYLQYPHPNNGRTECDGKPASDLSNEDINEPVESIIMRTDHPRDNHAGKMYVYPNPVEDIFTVEMEGFKLTDNVILYAYDMQGKEIYKLDIKTNRTLKLNAKLFGSESNPIVLKAVSKTKTLSGKVNLAN